MRTIGKYEIVEELVKGDVGVYYKGQDLVEKKSFLIQELFPKHVKDDNFVSRFERAVKASQILQHENILRVFEFGKTENSFYNVSEFIEGVTLRQLLMPGRKVALEVALEIVLQLCRGLEYAHKEDIVHRNLKPVFISLGYDGIVRIADFGLAQNDEKLGTIHLLPTQFGTAHYLSSDLAWGKKLDQRTDIFSLGIIFYEMLAGFNPFEAEGFTAIFAKLKSDEPPKPLSSVDPDIPERVSAIVQKMLMKDRNQRYTSCADVRSDLITFIQLSTLPGGREQVSLYVKSPDSYKSALMSDVVPEPTPALDEPFVAEDTFFDVEVSTPPPDESLPPAVADEDMGFDLDLGDAVPAATSEPEIAVAEEALAQPESAMDDDFLDLDESTPLPEEKVETSSDKEHTDFFDLNESAGASSEPDSDFSTEPGGEEDTAFLDLSEPVSDSSPEPSEPSSIKTADEPKTEEFFDLAEPVSNSSPEPSEPSSIKRADEPKPEEFFDLAEPDSKYTPSKPEREPSLEPSGEETAIIESPFAGDSIFDSDESEKITVEPTPIQPEKSPDEEDLVFAESTDEIEMLDTSLREENPLISEDDSLTPDLIESAPPTTPPKVEIATSPSESLEEELTFTDFNEEVEILEDIPEFDESKVIEPKEEVSSAPSPEPPPKPEPKPKIEPALKKAKGKPKEEKVKPSVPKPSTELKVAGWELDVDRVLFAILGLLVLLNVLAFLIFKDKHTSVLWVESQPVGAKVLVDGIVRSSSTPCLIKWIPEGEHYIEVRKSGNIFKFKDPIKVEGGVKYSLKVVLQDPSKFEDKPEVPIRPLPIDAVPGLELRDLTVITEPADAQLYIDGDPIGTTPTETKVPVGAFEVMLIAVGYNDYITEIRESDQPDTLRVTLQKIGEEAPVLALDPEPEPPMVSTFTIPIVSNPPGATVYVDGKPHRAKTPTSVTLPVGDYPIRLVLEDHEEYIGNLYSGLDRIYVALEPVETPPPPPVEMTRPIAKYVSTAQSGARKIDFTKPSKIVEYFPGTYRRGVSSLKMVPQKVISSKEDLGYGELMIDVSFWTDIYIDGQYKDVTPLVGPLKLAPGTYKIRVVDPEDQDRDYYQEQITVVAGSQIVITASDFKKR